MTIPGRYALLAVHAEDMEGGAVIKLIYRRITAVSSALIFVAGVLILGGWRGGVLFQGPKPVPLTDANCSGRLRNFQLGMGAPWPPRWVVPRWSCPPSRACTRRVSSSSSGPRSTRTRQMIQQEVKDGDLVENHLWDHEDLTGQSSGAKPVTLAQAHDYLARGAQAIVKAGAPVPTLWRPPFDDVTPAYNAVAASLNERVVLSYGLPGSGIIDSQDWKGKFTGRADRREHHLRVQGRVRQ